MDGTWGWLLFVFHHPVWLDLIRLGSSSRCGLTKGYIAIKFNIPRLEESLIGDDMPLLSASKM